MIVFSTLLQSGSLQWRDNNIWYISLKLVYIDSQKIFALKSVVSMKEGGATRSYRPLGLGEKLEYLLEQRFS